MKKVIILYHLVLFALVTNTSCNAQKKNFFPFNDIKAFNIAKLIYNDTTIQNIKEFILLDTLTNDILIDNEGFSADIQIKNGDLYIKQYVAFTTSDKVCFSKYKLTFSGNKYCIKRIDNINFDSILTNIDESILNEYDKGVCYFLGCCSSKAEKYYQLLNSISKTNTHIYYKQLFHQGILNHYILSKKPKILLERKMIHKCNYIQQ